MGPIDLSGQHKTEETHYSNGKIKSKGSTYTYPIYYDNKVTGKKHQYFGELVKREKEWKYWFLKHLTYQKTTTFLVFEKRDTTIFKTP